MGRRSRRTTVPAGIRLAITLRIMAGADVWDLVAVFQFKLSTIYRVLEDAISALNIVMKLPRLPKTLQDLHRSAMLFKTSRKSPNPLNGCVGALDGLAVKIKKSQEEGNPAVYYSRKDFYALCVQAMVDSNYTFFILLMLMCRIHARLSCTCCFVSRKVFTEQKFERRVLDCR